MKIKGPSVPPMLANRLARLCAYSAKAPEWEQFVRLITPLVALSARRVGVLWGDTSPTTVSEIVQDVFLKLCEDDRRILRQFEDRGNESFLKLLRVITASVGTDYFRRTRAEKRGGRSSTISLDTPVIAEQMHDPEGPEAVQWATVVAQIGTLLHKFSATVSTRDRTLFWLYYRQGFTADAISQIPSIGLSAKGVESALGRMTRLLREAVINNKANPELPLSSPEKSLPSKGFSQVIAINSVKRR